MKRIAGIFLCLLLTTGFAAARAPAPAKLYAVVYSVVADAKGKVVQVRLQKVVDPASGKADAVEIKVPGAFTSAVRKTLARRTYSGDGKEFFTYFFYDPAQPGRIDIDPAAPKPGD